MMLRIIHGKLKPGTWDSYERAYKEAVAKAGKIPGLKGRWLAHADDDPMPGIRSACGRTMRRCALMRTAKFYRTRFCRG